MNLDKFTQKSQEAIFSAQEPALKHCKSMTLLAKNAHSQAAKSLSIASRY
ncbi:MAG: hypothetical protein WBV22_07225 [Anaerolineaceae bacterium]